MTNVGEDRRFLKYELSYSVGFVETKLYGHCIEIFNILVVALSIGQP